MAIDPLLPPDKDKVSQNDPIQTLRAEFNIEGKGLSGNYRKNWVTRLGFMLVSLPLIGFGIVFWHFFFKDFEKKKLMLELCSRFYGQPFVCSADINSSPMH